ncbi:TonB-dependent receptor [Exilibacterium tricleocarpae]|uniref:TonB-dependent receptor n=1 Tax=Exilibacterium tricleocarpae TaxID=2591008 RepID=A0A545TVY5_9GAMM|nr:TonB-dependent receptor [Exilibacterium tricleocarpae]TQV81362.1 TonB-dependent receptor [Exilibacterium tricleocarpae]
MKTEKFKKQCNTNLSIAICRPGTSAALCALVLSLPAPDVWSQTDDRVDEEILVTGTRLSQRRAIEAKRLADGIVDAVSADDIGKLPDKNAAEAVDRLPGVSISIDQGEGRFVSIRGISPALNNLTINGVTTGSPEADDGGRLAPLDVIGGDFLKAIEVVKAQTPDMDAQGVGGTINVVTAGPFDQEEVLFGTFTGQFGYEDLSKDSPYAAKFTLGGLDSSRTWGWLLGASYSYRDFESRGVFQDDWREETLDGVSARLPENAKNNFYTLERIRTGVNAQVEWRPTDADRYYARAFFSRFEEEEVRQRYEHFFNRDITALTPTGGTSGTNNRREQDARYEEKDKEFFNIAIGGENAIGETWLLDYVAQYNQNRQTEPNRRWEFRGDGYGPDTWRLNSRGFALIQSGPTDVLDPARLRFRRVLLQDNETEEDALILGLNARRQLPAFGDAGQLKFGVKYTATDRTNDAANTRYNLGDNDWFLSDFGHFGGVLVNDIDGVDFPNLAVDIGAATAFLNANRNNTAFFELDDEDTFENEFENDYDITEDISAVYLMGEWAWGEHEVIAGLRLEHTEVDSKGLQRDADNLTAIPISQSGNYTNLLPAVIYRVNLEDDLVLRAAWTNTLGRPDFNQIAPISSLSREGSEGALFIGNPDLEARESANFDLSLEYYFAQDALLSLAVFYKDIDNFIVERSEQRRDFTFNGELFDEFTVTTLENATAAELEGVELSYQQQFDFLPSPWSGFGVALSFAWIDSEIEIEGRDDKLPLIQQPDWTRSYTLFYQAHGFEASLSLDESDAFLADILDSREEDLQHGEYGRLDFKASYAVDDRYSVFFEWQNINDEPNTEFQGLRERQNTGYEVYGQTFYLGLTVNF